MSGLLASDGLVGRYALCGQIAAGGMATVHLGKSCELLGKSRVVAIKALHPQFAQDPDFLSMLLDEARLTARIEHPNVVSVLDVVSRGKELYLVMEYVVGENLSTLARRARARGQAVPTSIALRVMVDALRGLHAAHEARDEWARPLGIVHRDVSPQNIIVGVDGAARLLDFGVAKAAGRAQITQGDQLKGKLAYMAPEQLERRPLDARADIYAAGIVLWELLTGKRLFQADDEVATFVRALDAIVAPPSLVEPHLPALLDPILLKALARDRNQRFTSAREMVDALTATGLLATPHEVGLWVESLAKEVLEARARRLAAVEHRDHDTTLGAEPSWTRRAQPILSASASGLETRTEVLVAWRRGTSSGAGEKTVLFVLGRRWQSKLEPVTAVCFIVLALVEGWKIWFGG